MQQQRKVSGLEGCGGGGYVASVYVHGVRVLVEPSVEPALLRRQFKGHAIVWRVNPQLHELHERHRP